MEELYIIAGLGNPGDRYANTKHNVGFDAIDNLARKHGIQVSKLKFKALLGDGTINGTKVVLVKPQTYMNLSGESIRDIMNFYKVKESNFIAIYDDIDIPFAKIRIKPSGSAGSHNGMKSIIYQLNSDKFPRVRIGIDKAPEGWDLADYVLSKFTQDERKLIDVALGKACEAVESIITKSIDQAMNLFNK